MKVISSIVSVGLFSIAILFSSVVYSIEINELDEITMQVLDIDNNDLIDTQQMVKIPVPIMRKEESNLRSKSFSKSSLTERKPRELNAETHHNK